MTTTIALGNNWRNEGPEGVNPSERPDRFLSIESRLTAERAWEQYQAYREANRNALLVLTGGRTNEQVPCSEAVAMKEYLRRKGMDVDNENIILEEESLNTPENATNTRELLEARNDESDKHITVVTSPYHLKRARSTFMNEFPDSLVYGVESTSLQAGKTATDRDEFAAQITSSWDWRKKYCIDLGIRLISMIDRKGRIIKMLTKNRGQ